MKTIALTILTAALVLICDPASAQTRGVGMTPCSQWKNGREWNAKKQWALGYVSGAELTSSSVSDDAIIAAVGAWCGGRPKESIRAAAEGATLSWWFHGGPNGPLGQRGTPPNAETYPTHVTPAKKHPGGTGRG